MQRRNGAVVGYSVYLGVDGEGRKLRRFFHDRTEANRYLGERDKTPLPIGELWDRRAEILYNLERLRPANTNLTDVVTFYLDRQGSTMGTKILADVVDEFLSEKLQVGRSQQYDRVMRQSLGRFVKFVGADRRIGDVARQEITNCVYQTNKHPSSISKKNIPSRGPQSPQSFRPISD